MISLFCVFINTFCWETLDSSVDNKCTSIIENYNIINPFEVTYIFVEEHHSSYN